MKFFIKKIYRQYKDMLAYLFFGVGTTCVNLVIYYIFARFLAAGTMISTIIAWITAVLFAYLTNRKWVFHSQVNTVNEIIKELVSFFSCRLATGVVDWVLMLVFVDILKMNDMVIKFLANVIVVILNYIASKWIIFKKNVRR